MADVEYTITNFIVLDRIKDITDFVNAASRFEKHKGDILLLQGKQVVEATSLLGVLSLDTSKGVIVSYPNDLIEFNNFIKPFILEI